LPRSVPTTGAGGSKNQMSSDSLQREAPRRPRISPGSPAEIGRLNFTIARALGVAAGSEPPNIFTTLARHRGLFRRWLRFAGALMPGGRLPRSDSELVILRVAHNTGCEYEWAHHERIAAGSGLSSEDVQRVRRSPEAEGFSARQRLLLRAADELHANRVVSAEVWDALRPQMSDADLIELCMLVGHYEMLAMTLNSLQVAPDALAPGGPPRLARAVQVLASRRQRGRGRR
jgi:AhpD family alkylhydroperoxidase